MAAQFFWYLIVGGTAFVADLVVFVSLLKLGLGVLQSSAIGFIVGTAVNYVLTLRLAFTGGRYRRAHEIVRLLAVALIGLGLTTLLLWVFVAAGMAALPAKLLAVAIVFAWNYLGRRLFVFHREMPVDMWRLSDAAFDRLARHRPRRGG